MPVSPIEEFYVIAPSGLCVFSKKTGHHYSPDADLVAGYLNVLNSMSQNIAEGGITSLCFENSQLVINHSRGMQFVARTSTAIDSETVEANLLKFSNRFFKMFSTEYVCTKWTGNIDVFRCLDVVYHRFLGNAFPKLPVAM
ncbi:MAG TPA: hypothetical protein VKK79_03685 [Candidatus Lokiarchaeia archaeon]|nr:hypothetical protein [Candidatus Lokiarchaeia archaeon]